MSLRLRPAVRLRLFTFVMRSLLRVLVFLALCSQKSFSSSIHPGVNHENFSLNWDAATEKFLISNQPYPQLSLYDNNHYIFYNNSSQSIYLSDSPNSNYLGTQVFNNGVTVNGEYLVYSPESNESISIITIQAVIVVME